MKLYVGMDVHRKRSQIAVLDAAGDEQRNRNVPNAPVKLVPILAYCRRRTPAREGARRQSPRVPYR
jgi:hypothetical protein